MSTEAVVCTIIWDGVTIEVSYEADWLGCNAKHGHQNAHIELRVQHPERARLPVTDTGYRSYFLGAGVVEAMGGPEKFVTHWLDQMANSTEWRRQKVKHQQLDLFQ